MYAPVDFGNQNQGQNQRQMQQMQQMQQQRQMQQQQQAAIRQAQIRQQQLQQQAAAQQAALRQQQIQQQAALAQQAQMRAQQQQARQAQSSNQKQQKNQTHIFFYSVNCGHCKNFFERIQRSEKYRMLFRYFSVDPKGPGMKRPPLPSFIKEVPTVVIGRNIYIGEGAFEWLDSTNNEQEKEIGPQAYIPSEMSNWSDSYEFLDGNQVSQMFKNPYKIEDVSLKETEPEPEERSYSNYVKQRNNIGAPQKKENFTQESFRAPSEMINSEKNVEKNYRKYKKNRMLEKKLRKEKGKPKEIDFRDKNYLLEQQNRKPDMEALFNKMMEERKKL